MKTIDDIRRENLRQIERESGSPSAAAARLEMSPSQFSNLRDGAKDSKTGKPRGMSSSTARRIEGKAGKPSGWLDQHHGSVDSAAAGTSAVNVHQLAEPPEDPLKTELLELFSQLGREDKIKWLGDLRGYVRAMRPHSYGAASAVAGK